MTTIHLDTVSKRFGDMLAVKNATLSMPQGSFTALLGPSGCGKTTLLRLIAGFEQPTAGAIRFGETTIASPTTMVPPERRGLGIVFQSYALWPHMDVATNVAYPLKAQGVGRAEIETRVEKALSMVSLTGFGARSVDALSGGQRQRVALARCLVTGTDIILLDEPLANLDVHLRASMLDVFAEIHQRTGATIVYVTHDQAEALALADRIVVLDAGQVQQHATPQALYAEPANKMVAGFVGRGTVVGGRIEAGQASLAGHAIRARGGAGRSGPVSLLLRPENLRLAEAGIAAEVTHTRYAGPVYESVLTLPSGETLMVDTPLRPQPGSTVHVAVDDAWIIPA